jgi:hypothetical protein
MAFDLSIDVKMFSKQILLHTATSNGDGPIGGQNAIFGGIEE